MPGIAEFLAGAFTAIAAEETRDAIKAGIPKEMSDWEVFLKDFPSKFDKLCSDLAALSKSETMVPFRKTANLFAYPSEQYLHYYGHNHISVFTTNGFQCRLWLPDAGAYTPNLVAGWNALDVTDGSTISLPLGTVGNQTILILASSQSMGNAI